MSRCKTILKAIAILIQIESWICPLSSHCNWLMCIWYFSCMLFSNNTKLRWLLSVFLIRIVDIFFIVGLINWLIYFDWLLIFFFDCLMDNSILVLFIEFNKTKWLRLEWESARFIYEIRWGVLFVTKEMSESSLIQIFLFLINFSLDERVCFKFLSWLVLFRWFIIFNTFLMLMFF